MTASVCRAQILALPWTHHDTVGRCSVWVLTFLLWVIGTISEDAANEEM